MSRFFNYINKNYFDITSICILMVCCFVSLFWEWFSLAIVLMCAFYFIASSNEKSLGLVAFLTPFHYVLRIASITMIVYLIYVSFLVVAFIKLIKNRELKFNNIVFVILACILVYSLLPFGTYKLIRWRWLSTFLIIISSCFILKQLVNKIEFSKIVYCLFLGLLFSSIFRVMLNSNEFIDKFALNYDSSRFEALMINTNYFSEACAMLCSMLLVVLFKNKNTIFTSIAFITTLCLGLLTRSKTFILLSVIFIAVFLVYYLIIAIKKRNIPLQIVLGAIFISSIVFAYIYIKTRINFNDNLTTTDVLSNRNTIWKMAFKDLSKNALTLLFGLGLGSEIRWENAQTCHSVYIEILQKFGIIGSLLFVGLTIYCLVLLFKNYKIKNNLINLFPVLILAIYSFTDTIIFPATSMMIFPLCFVCLFYNLPKKEKLTK